MPPDAPPTIARVEALLNVSMKKGELRVSSNPGHPYRKGTLLEPRLLTRPRLHRTDARVAGARNLHREGARGPGAKLLGERAIEPLTPHPSHAYAHDLADTLSVVHRSMPDAVVPDESI